MGGLMVGVRHSLYVAAGRRHTQHGDDGKDAGASADFDEYGPCAAPRRGS